MKSVTKVLKLGFLSFHILLILLFISLVTPMTTAILEQSAFAFATPSNPSVNCVNAQARQSIQLNFTYISSVEIQDVVNSGPPQNIPLSQG